MPATAAMTERERYIAALTYGTPDRVPFAPGGARKSTRETWRRQGLPEGRDYMEVLREELGIEKPPPGDRVQTGVNFRMMPAFEEKVLEHRDGHYVVQDWMGNITEISDEFDYTYIRNAIDFVTRKWHSFPVETPEDFETKMKWRYDPEAPGRFPEDFAERCRKMRDRAHVAGIRFSGPFWQLREWCGFEPLCMKFIEEPEFVKEMISFWTDFVSRTMAPILEAGVIDYIGINEDMAYKEKAMISPAMTREFLKPCYDRWVAETRAAGVPLVDMDSDGKVDELIPIWIEAGMNVCDPLEVAAGNDINEYRREFGRKMAFRGGVDKRCMAKGGKVIEDELRRVEPVLRGGGYIPGCDHGVPPDISWPDFKHYARLLAEMTGWL
ncbi:MAG: uroporphyrinogen decarboxylase family protein [Planctomycetota bacterium]|jgi:uroporphyrinogen decarboxylase